MSFLLGEAVGRLVCITVGAADGADGIAVGGRYVGDTDGAVGRLLGEVVVSAIGLGTASGLELGLDVGSAAGRLVGTELGGELGLLVGA